MRLSWFIAAALLFAGGLVAGNLAQADEANVPGQPGLDGKMNVSVGIICNTSEQAAAYIHMRAGGSEIRSAVLAVNESVKDPKACGLAAVAYVRDKTMSTETVHGTLTSIVRINVVAGYDGEGWSRVPAVTQYAVIEAKGISI
jgi:hypothetical protein